MDVKFIRNYVMEIQSTFSAQNAEVIPTYITLQSNDPTQPTPFTLEFDIVRNTSNSAQANFRIYNLAPNTRQQILRDAQLAGTYQTIKLYAGYGLDVSKLPLIFSGYANVINSNRESVNVVTTVECIGFDYQNFWYTNTFSGGIPNQQIIAGVVAALGPQVQPGAVGTFSGTPPTGQSYSDFGVDVLNELTNNGFYIDNNLSYCLNQNECVKNPSLQVITAANGLIGSPVRRMTEVNLTMLFEPRLKIGQSLEVNSTINAYLNNTTFKVFKIVHKGTISQAIAGEALTEVTLQSLTNPIFVQGN